MTYRIAGLDPEPFAPLFALDEDALAARRARLDHGFPCRVSLEEAQVGERLLLVHHTHHAVDSPFRAGVAIFVREQAREAALCRDRTLSVFEGRVLSLRGFTAEGMLAGCALVQPGEADAAIRALLAGGHILYIDAHNAAAGCFAARIERDEA